MLDLGTSENIASSIDSLARIELRPVVPLEVLHMRAEGRVLLMLRAKSDGKYNPLTEISFDFILYSG